MNGLSLITQKIKKDNLSLYSCGIYEGNLFFVTPAVMFLNIMVFQKARTSMKISTTGSNSRRVIETECVQCDQSYQRGISSVKLHLSLQF